MLSPKDRDKYRMIIEEAVAALGRDDVGVNVEGGDDGMVDVTFTRGTLTHTARVPAEALGTHESAHIAVNKALLAFSKRVMQETLAKTAE